MERECEAPRCDNTFEARGRKRFCSATCRVNNHRTPAGKAAGEPEKKPAPTTGGLLAQVAAELVELNAVDTTRGRAALALAQRIESPLETGSAAASMTRELTRLMDEVKAAAAPTRRDGVDQLEEAVGAKLKLVSG